MGGLHVVYTKRIWEVHTNEAASAQTLWERNAFLGLARGSRLPVGLSSLRQAHYRIS